MFLDNVCKLFGMNFKNDFINYYYNIINELRFYALSILLAILIILFIISLFKKRRRLYSFLNIIKAIFILSFLVGFMRLQGVILLINANSYGEENLTNCSKSYLCPTCINCTCTTNINAERIEFKIIVNTIEIIISLIIITLIYKKQKKINLQE